MSFEPDWASGSRRLRAVARGALGVVTSLPGRIAITAILLWLVARSIEWEAVSEAVEGASWGWFALAIGALAGSFVIAALRWQPLLAAAAVPARLGLALRAYFVGAFANNVLPTGFGGDFVRAWIVARRGKPLARALTSVGVDRLSALACLLLVGWGGTAIDPGAIPGELAGLLAVASAGALAVLVVAVLVLRRRGLGRLLPTAVRPWAAEVAGVLRAYGRDPALAARVLALGVAFQVLVVAALWMLAEMIGAEIAASVLAVVVPLVLIATLAPISIAGFGVREGSFVVLLGEVGVSAADATLLSLLSVAAMALASLPGGIALLLTPDRAELEATAREAR